MRKAKLLLLTMFTVIASVAGALSLVPRTVLAAPASPTDCGNTYCNPGETSCSYHWNSSCKLSGTPPHYCEGWSTCLPS